MMTVRIISGTSEQNTCGPGAAGFANVSVVTTATEAPQLLASLSAVDIQLICGPPDIFETEVANIAARVFRCRERRTTFDCAVSLDAKCVLSGVTTGPVDAIVAFAAPNRLVRAVVADIVSRLKQKSAIRAFLVQLSEEGHQLQ